MYIVLFILLAAFGIFMITCPDVIYELKEGWKHESDSEPSESYKIWIRISGVLAVLVSIGGIIMSAFAYYHGEL